MFNTSDGSAALANPGWLVAGVSDLLAGLLADQSTRWLLSPATSGDSLELRQGTAVPGSSPATQNTCVVSPEPIPLDVVELPYFEAGPSQGTLPIADAALVVSQATLSGAFSPGGRGIDGLAMTGLLDTRELGGAFDLGDTPDAFRHLFAGFGIVCETCDDGLPLCLWLDVHDVRAASVDLEWIDVTPGMVEAAVQAGSCPG